MPICGETLGCLTLGTWPCVRVLSSACGNNRSPVSTHVTPKSHTQDVTGATALPLGTTEQLVWSFEMFFLKITVVSLLRRWVRRGAARWVVFVEGKVLEALPPPRLAITADRQVPRKMKSRASEGQGVWFRRVRLCVVTATSSGTLWPASSAPCPLDPEEQASSQENGFRLDTRPPPALGRWARPGLRAHFFFPSRSGIADRARVAARVSLTPRLRMRSEPIVSTRGPTGKTRAEPRPCFVRPAGARSDWVWREPASPLAPAGEAWAAPSVGRLSAATPPRVAALTLCFPFQAYMEDHLKNKNRLEKEWEALCAYQAEPNGSLVAQREENSPKNRCPAVLTCT